MSLKTKVSSPKTGNGRQNKTWVERPKIDANGKSCKKPIAN